MSATYDYIIVGAGSAGCVLAARLSEEQDVSVLVIEAGPPDEKENIHVPAAFGSLFKTDVDWDYATFPEAGCNNRMMYMPRGKMLGGSSSINAMVYIRGNRVDYDSGGSGWTYDEVLVRLPQGGTDKPASADAGKAKRLHDSRHDAGDTLKFPIF